MVRPGEPLCRTCFPKVTAVWTREAIVCAIQEWAEDHGGVPPTARAWFGPVEKRGPYPCVNEVRRRFGTWNAAIEAAGFQTHLSGPVGGFRALTADERAECARRYAAGESSNVIAADLGCAPAVVVKWARRAGVAIRQPFGKAAA
jgi:hypothetical protein